MENKYISNFLFSEEHLICSAEQSNRVIKWAILHLILFVVVMGIPIGLFMFLPFVPDTWKEYANNNSFVYIIYGALAGLWLVIYLFKLINRATTLAKYRVFLTDKRVLIMHEDKITTILFNSIISVAMRNNKDEEYTGLASIEIHTPAKVYEMDKMKNGNKLISLLTRILFGGTVRITPAEENAKPIIVSTKREKIENKINEEKVVEKELDPTDKVIEKNKLVQEKSKPKENNEEVKND